MPTDAGIIFRCCGVRGGAAAKPLGSWVVGWAGTAAAFKGCYQGGLGTLHAHTLHLEGSCLNI